MIGDRARRTEEDLRPPKDWAPEYEAQVLNPDGWRFGSPEYPEPKSWDEPVSRAEYESRLYASTITKI